MKPDLGQFRSETPCKEVESQTAGKCKGARSGVGGGDGGGSENSYTVTAVGVGGGRDGWRPAQVEQNSLVGAERGACASGVGLFSDGVRP